MAAKNKVIAGDYENKQVILFAGKDPGISLGLVKKILLDRTTVEEYEVIDETSHKSAVSAVGRAAVGGFLLGPVGLAAGLSAKSKGTHVLAVQFKDGCRSLLEVDDKIYKAILKKLF